MHIDSTYVIGWSDGGIDALVLAMRHPEKVIKLVSSGANLWPDSTALTPATWLDQQKEFEEKKNIKWTTEKEKNDWKIFLLDFNQPNVPLSALKAIRCPSLIMCGDHDVITIEHTAAIYKNIPRAYLWVIPNSSHSTFQDHTSDVEKKIDEFFRMPFSEFDR
jgi:pimeloyl-ACP methyl ester carboxylesterase